MPDTLPRGTKRARSGVHAHISLEELTFVAALLIVMFGDASLLAVALACGFDYLNSDAAIALSDDWVLVVEWDGEPFHSSDERKANDVRKTKSIIAKHENAIVIRLRSKCGDLPALAGEHRAIIIETKRNVAQAAHQVAAHLLASPMLQMPDTIAARLRTPTATKQLNAAAQAAAIAHHAALVPAFEKRVSELTAVAGAKVAGFLVRNSTRLVASGAAAPCVSRFLAAPFSLTPTQLVTFMCDGVAAAMERPTWWERLHSLLRPPFSLTPAQLPTFMCGGVAAAMERPTWWERLHALLRPPFSLTPKQLVTFTCNGVAAAMSHDHKWQFMATHPEVMASTKRARSSA